MTQRNQVHARWVEHTYRVENTILDLRRLIEEGETTRRGYLLAPDVPILKDAYRKAAQALPQRLAHLSLTMAKLGKEHAMHSGKLANPAYVEKAPQDLVERDQARVAELADAKVKLLALKERFAEGLR